MEILCPFCNKKIEKNNKNVTDEFIQFKDIKCSDCHKNFTFLLCKHCNQKIFCNSIELSMLNGINIKCPYSTCGKYFYLTICPKCKQNQKIPKIVEEGGLIKCFENKNCGYEYLFVRCPLKDCNDITYFARPKNYCNSPNGILYNHKRKIIFQKISCNFCVRPIVYYSELNKINRYYDSMKIVCAYKDCKKEFNRIICPICSIINIIEGGFYIMGHKIKCIGCKNFFGKILCPQCLKINPLTKNFFKSGGMICSYTACAKTSKIINCIYCRRMNVFNKNNNEFPIPGQQIKCAYKDCGRYFNEVYCPSCNELNPFIDDDPQKKTSFLFGKVYECIYQFCKKKYQFFVCPNCFTYSRTLDTQEGKKYICNKCQNSLSNWGCPYCHKTIMDKNSKLNYGSMVRCPSCQKEYSFCRCFECQKLIFAEKKYILGLSVKCDSCQKYSVNIVCPKCNTKISFLDRMEDMEDGEKIKCGNCNNFFEYKKNNADMIDDERDIYFQNLSALELIEGETIHFGKGCIDEKYLSIENLFIKIKDLNSNNNLIKKNKNLCILCHCDTKESIFYPCGHRCACYRCAVSYFYINKKCPRCNENSEAIVPKVYEQFNDCERKI